MNKQKLFNLLEYSAMSYDESQSCTETCEIIELNDKINDVQCFIRIMKNEIIIIFRGSDSCIDYKNDFDFFKKIIPYGNWQSKIRVHGGFLKGYKNEQIRGKILEIVKKYNNINDITIAGHSYGAALSVLCAIDLKYNIPTKNYEIALYGCPRVGNKAFADSYDKRIKKTYRIVNGNDVVTKVPLRIMGFKHVGTLIKVGFINVPFVLSLKDHSSGAYLKNLWKKYTP